MEPPKGAIDIQGRLAPLSCMISSKNLTTDVICNKCIILAVHTLHGTERFVSTFGGAAYG